VIDSIAPVLAWVPVGSPGKRQQPFRFEVEHVEGPVVVLSSATKRGFLMGPDDGRVAA